MDSFDTVRGQDLRLMNTQHVTHIYHFNIGSLILHIAYEILLESLSFLQDRDFSKQPHAYRQYSFRFILSKPDQIMEGLERLAAALPPAKFEAPCDCEICMLQYPGHRSSAGQVLNYAGHLSNEAATTKAAERTRSIQRDKDHIASMIKSHGNAILKKWRRDQQYRRNTLQRVDTHIYPTRDPLLNMLGTPGSTTNEEVTKNRMALLLPYINLEDLVEDSSVLINLLHNRSNYPPE